MGQDKEVEEDEDEDDNTTAGKRRDGETTLARKGRREKRRGGPGYGREKLQNDVLLQDSLYQTDHVGVTALHAAVKAQGNAEVARALLEAKVSPSAPPSLLPPPSCSSEEEQADVDARTLKGNTPLLFAANSGHLECAKVAEEEEGRGGG
eukprot:762132-Hanusia_phi.AAC.2